MNITTPFILTLTIVVKRYELLLREPVIVLKKRNKNLKIVNYCSLS